MGSVDQSAGRLGWLYCGRKGKDWSEGKGRGGGEGAAPRRVA